MSQLIPSNLQAGKIVKVTSLTDKSKRWKISVEVKSKSKTIVSEKRGTYFKVTLMDGSGTINAKAFGSQSAQKFFKQFEENKKYIISSGNVRKVNKTNSNTHEYQIRLTHGTSVTLCDDIARQSRAGNTRKTKQYKTAANHDIVEEREDSAISKTKRKPKRDMNPGLKRTDENATKGVIKRTLDRKKTVRKCLPVTQARSDSDDEDLEQKIVKPLPSTTKRRNVPSSNSEVTLSKCRSTRKRRKCTQDDGKLSHVTPKKKLKRSEADEEEEEDDDDDDDGELHWTKDSPNGGRENIQKLRDIIENDRTKQQLPGYLSWILSMAVGNSRKGEKNKDIFEGKDKLEDSLEVAMKVCKSQAWCKGIRIDIRKYPEFVEGMTRNECPKSDKRMLKTCEVCNRENPWWSIATLKGKPYKRKTFEEADSEDKGTEFSRVKYYMGKYCHKRIKLFHGLYHFGCHLYKICRSMLKNGKTKDEIASDKVLLNKMRRRLRKWFKKADNDYTKGFKRVNNRCKKGRDEMLSH